MRDGVRLMHTQNRIIFDFLSICLVNPGAVRYQFMLEGADKDWITTNQSRAAYSSLGPGGYTFMVRASNNYGYWNEVPAKLSFSIRGPGLCHIMVYHSMFNRARGRDISLHYNS